MSCLLVTTEGAITIWVGLFGPPSCTIFIVPIDKSVISIAVLHAYAVNPHGIQGGLSQLERTSFREMRVDTTDHQLGFQFLPVLYNRNNIEI